MHISVDQLYDEYPSLTYGDPHSVNHTKKYHAGDSEKLYQSNLKEKGYAKKLAEYGYLDKIILYNFNAQGFRSSYDYLETTNHERVAAFGCSNTLGEGVHIENAWPTRLGRQLKVRMYNFGVSGGSADTNLRHARYWLKIIKPQRVFWLVPVQERFELIRDLHPTNSRPLTIMPTDQHGHKKFYQEWTINDANMLLHQEKNILAMQQLCDSLKIKLHIMHRIEYKHEDWGRDLRHPGVKTHRTLATSFYNQTLTS